MHFPQYCPQGEEFHQLGLQAEEHAHVVLQIEERDLAVPQAEECYQLEHPIEGSSQEEE